MSDNDAIPQPRDFWIVREPGMETWHAGTRPPKIIMTGSEVVRTREIPYHQDQKLGRFRRHVDPAKDFRFEVEDLEDRFENLKDVPTEDREDVLQTLLTDIGRALDFNVGGNERAVSAKSDLRELSEKAVTELKPSSPAGPSADLRAAARLLHEALSDPDTAPDMTPFWHAAYDAMKEDHAQNMAICNEEDWPSTLLAALEAIANGPEAGKHE